MGTSRNVGFLEPYFGGSHSAATLGWARASRHAVTVLSLPARFWKWRMRGAAFEFAHRVEEEELRPDLWFAASTLDAAHFLALSGGGAPLVLYFHENQAAYPGRPDEEGAERDYQYVFTELASSLAAARIAFNSAFQRDAFFEGLEAMLRRMPDARPLWALERLHAKCEVLPLGVDLEDLGSERAPAAPGEAPLILWNHRWEYDKDPESFFAVLEELSGEGMDFRLAVAGERFKKAPPVFARARERLSRHVVHWGYAPSREAYAALLRGADIVVSTAIQENFGISMVEAAYAGAHPLAPRRLAYPEVFDASIHADCLYDGVEELGRKLRRLLLEPGLRLDRGRLREIFGRYDWRKRAESFDNLVDGVLSKEGV